MNALSSGPPTAMRTSGRFESRSIAPYRGPSGREQVAVTPRAASAATNPRSGPATAAGSSGAITSATPMAVVCRSPPGPVTVTRAADDRPNHSCAGLSSVYQCSATSAPAAPNGRPTAVSALW